VTVKAVEPVFVTVTEAVPAPSPTLKAAELNWTTAAGSVSVMAKLAVAGDPSAPLPATFERVSETVSSASSTESFVTGTVKVWVAPPAAKITVPLAAV
jgi:hypothetical protein